MLQCRCAQTALKEQVPLKSIEVELQVRDHVATVVSTLNYENKEDKALEAVFVFPLPGDAAVCHFSAKIGQTHIVAEVKEKQQAREVYDDALSSGQQAFLLEESDESPDIFSLSVGSLPPGESASIRLEYVTELAVQADDGLRFCLPAVLNPRYQPHGAAQVVGLQGPPNFRPSYGTPGQVTSVPASLVPYSLSFLARVSSPRPVSKIESNCSLEPLQFLNADQTQAMVKLAAGHKFDRDVELLIYYKDAHQPSALVEAGQASAKPGSLMGDPVVMVSLYPEFPQSVMSSLASSGEFVFLLDRSGSMGCPINYRKHQETRISSARDTLLLLLKSLPMGCYFNIYSFGSRFEHIFPKSVEYNENSMEEALKKVKVMQADLGGTEILEPLKNIYSQPCIPKQLRQLFVFTDGEVGNTKAVLDLVRKNAGSHRCFSFGIGEGASTALVNGLAKEGGGHAQFITGTDRMQPKVMQSLRFALQPAVEDVSVTWDLPKGVSATVLSPPITAIFQGQRSLVYAQLTGQSPEAAEGCVMVKYSLADHSCQNQQRFSLKPAEDTGFTAHRLAARTLIRSLELEERQRRQQDKGVKKRVVELSVQSGVSSSFTAFVAVNKDSGESIQGPLVNRTIPTPSHSLSGAAFSFSHILRSAPGPYIGGAGVGAPLLGSMASPGSHIRPGAAFSFSQAVRSAPSQPCISGAGVGAPLLGSMASPGSHSMPGAAFSFSQALRSAPSQPCIGGVGVGAPLLGLMASPGMSFGAQFRSPMALTGIHSVPGAIPPSPVFGGRGVDRAIRDYIFKASRKRAINEEVLYAEDEVVDSQQFLQLVYLQKASGCWMLDEVLAAVLEKTSEEVEMLKPAVASNEMWATILALIWLHGFKMDAKEEWELLGMKAASWVRAQNAPCVTECVEAGNALLGCSVQKDALGI